MRLFNLLIQSGFYIKCHINQCIAMSHEDTANSLYSKHDRLELLTVVMESPTDFCASVSSNKEPAQEPTLCHPVVSYML